MSYLRGNKDIIKMALPISLSIAFPQINFLTNTAFLGQLGERELSVNGIAGIFYLILSMVGYGLSIGVQIQLARRAGEGDTKSLTATFSNGLLLSLLFSIFLMLMSFLLTPLFFSWTLNDYENRTINTEFLYYRAWGLPMLLLAQLINTFFISINKSRFLTYSSLTATVATILFDYLLIFGNYGFEAMGVKGSAIASVLGEAVGFITLCCFFIFNKFYRIYPIHRYFKWDMSQSLKSLKVAAPLIVQFLFSIGGWQIFFIFVEHLGNKELAASQILRSIFGIVSIGTWALATTCNTMVSHAIGEGREQEVVPLIKRISRMSISYVLIICTLLLAFSTEFLSLYRNDADLIALALPSLRIIIAGTLVMSLATVAFNGVVGTGNTMINLSIEIVCVLIYLGYCYVVIQRMKLPLHWAWGSEFVYWGTLLAISYAYLASGRWKGKKL